MLTASGFQEGLDHILQEAQRKGLPSIIMKAGDLHRQVGGYPGDHRMPVCCGVMRRNMKTGDTILDEPAKGTGANLVIRYKLPR